MSVWGESASPGAFEARRRRTFAAAGRELAGPVVAHRRLGVGVPGGDLHVRQLVDRLGILRSRSLPQSGLGLPRVPPDESIGLTGLRLVGEHQAFHVYATWNS